MYKISKFYRVGKYEYGQYSLPYLFFFIYILFWEGNTIS